MRGADRVPRGVAANPVSIRTSFHRLVLACAAMGSLAGPATAAGKPPPPSYGRPPAKAPASHALDWPARVVFFPAWLVTQVVLRQPLGALVRGAESSETLQKAQDSSSDGPLKELTILPAVRLDLGLKPMVGVNASWRYRRNLLDLQASTWGVGYVQARLGETYRTRPDQDVSFETTVSRRKDTPFYGLGPRSLDEARTRFESNTFRMQAGYTADFWRSSRIKAAFGGRGLWFGDGACCEELSTHEAALSRNDFAPGLDQDYAAGFQRVELALDTRPITPTRGVAFRLEGFEEASFAVAGTQRGQEPRRGWIQYGGSLGATIDLTGTRRMLAVTVHTRFADPLQGQVPFTDQAMLGGDDLMPGFLRGRLVDRSALVMNAQYTWPFWTFLDGMLQAAVGNVFAEHLRDVDVRAMRYSAGIGIRTKGNPASRFEALFAVGSKPFDEGGAIDSIRVLVGTQHGLF